MIYRAKNFGGQKFGDAIAIGDTGKRTNDGQQIVLLRGPNGFHETSSVNLSRGVYTGYHGSKRNREVGKRISHYLTKKDRIKNGKKGAASLKEKYFHDGTADFFMTQKISKNNNSGVKGVSFDSKRGKWLAYMTYKGKVVLKKRFNTKDEAIAARKAAEHKYLGGN